jgi:hypothetical protein
LEWRKYDRFYLYSILNKTPDLYHWPFIKTLCRTLCRQAGRSLPVCLVLMEALGPNCTTPTTLRKTKRRRRGKADLFASIIYSIHWAAHGREASHKRWNRVIISWLTIRFTHFLQSRSTLRDLLNLLGKDQNSSILCKKTKTNKVAYSNSFLLYNTITYYAYILIPLLYFQKEKG